MIITNQLDKNEYKYYELKNESKFLFIRDPKLDKSAISVSFNTGSFNDTLPGMAHFLEHMLFMGTEKYPKENEFTQYLSQHNGNYNAFTCDDNTVYYFDIDPKYFLDGIKIFSQFFQSPIFDASVLEREICAVDSEFKMNLRNDSWRINRLVSKFSVINGFGVGNKETLCCEDIRERMMNFYKENYSSDEMCIIVYHNEDISDFVIKEFEGVKKLNGKINSVLKHINKANAMGVSENSIGANNNSNVTTAHTVAPKHDDMSSGADRVKAFRPWFFNKYYLNKIILVESIKDIKELQIRIEVPKVHVSFANKSFEYIKFMMLNKNKNSLNDRLKKEGFSYNLSFLYEITVFTSICKITVNLTKKGYKNIQKILELIKNEINYCEVNESKYEKIKETELKNFKYKEKINSCDFVVDISYDIQYYPIKHVIDHDYVYERYDKEEIESILEILSDNKNWLVFLVSQDMSESVVQDMSESVVQRIAESKVHGVSESTQQDMSESKVYGVSESGKQSAPESVKQSASREKEIMACVDGSREGKRLKVEHEADSASKIVKCKDITSATSEGNFMAHVPCEPHKMHVEEFYQTKYKILNEIILEDKIEIQKENTSFYNLTFIYNNNFAIPKSIISINLNKKISKTEFVPFLFFLEFLNEIFYEKYDDFLYFNSIDFSVDLTNFGAEIKIEGFNNKIEESIENYLNELNELQNKINEKDLESDNFEIIKEKLLDDFIKIKNKQSFRRVFDFYKSKVFGENEIEKIINEIKEFKIEKIKFYKKCFFEIFVTGNENFGFKRIIKNLADNFEPAKKYNINNEIDDYKNNNKRIKSGSVKKVSNKKGLNNNGSNNKTLSISDKDISVGENVIETINNSHVAGVSENVLFNSNAKGVDSVVKPQLYNLSMIDDCLSFYSEDKQNNSVGLFIESGKTCEYQKVAKHILTLQLSKELFFDTLRTKEALGYVAANKCFTIKNRVMFYFLIQSEKDCGFLKERIFKFLNELNVEINNLSVDDLETLKEGAVNLLNEDFNNLEEFFNYHKKLYDGDCLSLDYKNELIKNIQTLGKNDMGVFDNFTIVEAHKKLD